LLKRLTLISISWKDHPKEGPAQSKNLLMSRLLTESLLISEKQVIIIEEQK